MNILTTILGLVNPALGIIGAFTGSAKAAKVNAAVQDATAVVSALWPLVEQFTGGKEVTPDDVRAALDGMDAHLDSFEKAIAASDG